MAQIKVALTALIVVIALTVLIVVIALIALIAVTALIVVIPLTALIVVIALIAWVTKTQLTKGKGFKMNSDLIDGIITLIATLVVSVSLAVVYVLRTGGL